MHELTYELLFYTTNNSIFFTLSTFPRHSNMYCVLCTYKNSIIPTTITTRWCNQTVVVAENPPKHYLMLGVYISFLHKVKSQVIAQRAYAYIKIYNIIESLGSIRKKTIAHTHNILTFLVYYVCSYT